MSSGFIPISGEGVVEVTTSAALTVGSTDVVMEFDPSVLQALGASSTTLTGFTFFIDNTAGTVTTASAAFPSDVLGAGDELFTVEFAGEALALPGTPTDVNADRDAHGDHRRAGRHRL